MTTHEIRLDRYCAQAEGVRGRLVLGTWNSYGIEQLQLVLGDGWDGRTVTAVFHGPKASTGTTVLAGIDGLVAVPQEATASAGYGTITIVGVDADSQRISVDIPYVVMSHAPVTGQSPDPTPDQWQQFVAAVKADADRAEQAAKDASTSADAAEKSAQAAAESAKQAAQATADIGEAKDDALEAIQQAQDTGVQAIQTAHQAALDDIATDRQQALTDIEGAGDKQTAAITSGGAAALEAIGQVEQAAIGQVQEAGAAQVDAVNAAGQAQMDKINAANALVPTPTEADAGKAVVVRADGSGYELGKVQTDAYTRAESDARYAPIAAAIRPTVIGNPATLEHSVEWAMQGLKVYGKSTQQTTTGAQLIDTQAWQTADSEYYKVAKDGGMIQLKDDWRDIRDVPIFLALEAGEYAASISSGFVLRIVKDGANLVYLNYPNNYKTTFTLDSPATVGIKVYEYPSTNIYPSPVAYPMLNSGSTAKPWEPYTGGKPSPSPDYPQEIVTAGSDRQIDISVSDGADQSQQLSIPTPNGLPGIPVDSGGNFTDETGQQWICDEVDFERGVYVQRCAKVNLSGTPNFKETLKAAQRYIWQNAVNVRLRTGDAVALSNFSRWSYWGEGDYSTFCLSQIDIYYKYNKSNAADEVNDLFSSLIENNKCEVIGQLETPIETPLSAEELAAYAALRSYNGTTIVSTEAPVAGLSARYVADGAAYIDRKIQAAITQAVTAATALTGGAK